MKYLVGEARAGLSGEDARTRKRQAGGVLMNGVKDINLETNQRYGWNGTGVDERWQVD